MFFRLIIVFAIIIICSNILAQNTNNINQTEKDYKKFHETLREEIQSANQDTANLSDEYVLHPAHLPDWFCQMPKSDQQTKYAIGISDPGMEEDNAFKLAELRAKSILSLLLQPAVTGITDNFSNERIKANADEFTTKYVNYFRILSKLSVHQENFEIVERFFTSFNEAIVLLKYNKSVPLTDVTDSIIVVVDVYQAERQKYNKFEMEEKYEITGKFINDTCVENFYYSFQALNNLFEITSNFNKEEIKFPYMNFRYQGQNQGQSFEFNNSAGNKLNYGLWKSFMETILQEIIIMSQYGSVAIKQVGDDFTSINQNLSREISEASLSFKINSIEINNNRLSVNMDYLNKK